MTYLLVTCKVLSQSPLQRDQYRSSIKSPVLLYSSDLSSTTIMHNSQDFDVNQPFNKKLHFVNRYCFCNTELRTATITKIKGLSIQTQQNMFVLFTLFKLTLDECKTLTKISTRKTSHNRSPNPRTPQTTTKRQNSKLRQKAFCITGGESKALGFHQETTEESRTQQNWFCIKLYIILYQISFILAVWF